MSSSPEPVELTPVRVKIELNDRTPSWCPQRTGELLGVELLGDIRSGMSDSSTEKPCFPAQTVKVIYA